MSLAIHCQNLDMDSPMDDSLHKMELCFQDVENKMGRRIVEINIGDPVHKSYVDHKCERGFQDNGYEINQSTVEQGVRNSLAEQEYLQAPQDRFVDHKYVRKHW